MDDRIPLYEAAYSATLVNGATLTTEQVKHIVDTVLAVQMKMVSDRIASELGGVEVSEPKLDLPASEPDGEGTALAPTPEGVGPRGAAERVAFSRRAQTDRSLALDRSWRPSYYGYTAEHLHRDYPGVHPQSVLESFLSYYIANGQTSKNWLERFFTWCAREVKYEAERQAGKTDTDSMGLPLDPGARLSQRRAEADHYREQEEFYRQQESEQP